MASISNLAVIISGQTKPLEDAMKKAESKVSSFGKSFKEGIGLGAGVMGLDKLEQAMKKALGDFPGLAEAAEGAEKAFGGMLLKVTGMTWLLPKVADFLEFWSDKITGVTREMREQQKLQERALEFQKELRDARVDDVKALNDSLDAQLDAIDPLREQLRIVEKLKDQTGTNSSPIALQEARRKFELVQANKTKEKVKEIEAATAKWNEQLDEAEGHFGEMYGKLLEYQETFGPMTAEQAALEKRNDLIAEARKLMEEQIPVVDKLRARYEEAKNAGFEGAELAAFKKAYDEAALTQAKAKKTVQDTKLSGAATAGSELAYSIITRAQVDNGAQTLVTETKTQTKEIKSQSAALTKLVEQPFWRSTFAANVHLMKL